MNKHKVNDSHSQNWSDKWLPQRFKPYFQLMRLDRPVGIWLLLWPCFWGLLIALIEMEGLNVLLSPFLVVYYVILFTIGAVIMRGAGCVYNDLVDYKFDAKVKRTQNRPLPSGRVSPKQAKYFLLLLLALGFLVLIQFNWFSFFVGAASLILIASYPWMKRFTHWPQLFLGLTFNWGALLGFSALSGTLSASAIFLYLGGVFWTVGYDTIYAHQDKDDDMLIGLKSTALLFADKTKIWLVGLYGFAIICFLAAGLFAGLGLVYVIMFALISLQLFWQVYKLDLNNADLCLRLFKSNILFGGAVCLVLIVAYWVG